MGLVTFMVVLFVAAVNGKPTHSNEIVVTSLARLVKVDSMTGRRLSLHKQDIEKLGKDSNYDLVLNFDNEWSPIALRVSHSSVWDGNSVVVVRRGQRTTTIPNELNGNCFLHGKSIDPVGAVSITRCGHVSGTIQTPDYHYTIEELDSPEGEDDLAYTTFKVTKRKQEPEAMGKDDEQDALDRVKKQLEAKMADTQSNQTLRTKRQANGLLSINIELVAYLDADIVHHLYYDQGMETEEDIRNWVINKWNTVQGVFSDPEEIGARVTFALKMVEIWWENPDYYPASQYGIEYRFDWFCVNTPETNDFDLKFLYTKNIGGNIYGLANLGAACHQDHKCCLVRSSTNRVRVEIHELGHSLGFSHDPLFPGGCDPAGGFMGWEDTYRYLPCYKKMLQKELRDPYNSYDCLFEENVFHRQVLSNKNINDNDNNNNNNDNEQEDPNSTIHLPPTIDSGVDEVSNNNNNNSIQDDLSSTTHLPPTTYSSIDQADNNNKIDKVDPDVPHPTTHLPPTTDTYFQDTTDDNNENNNDNNQQQQQTC